MRIVESGDFHLRALLRTQSEQSGACAALRALGPLQQQSTRDPKLSYLILQMIVGSQGTLGGMLRTQQCAAANILNALPSSRTYGS